MYSVIRSLDWTASLIGSAIESGRIILPSGNPADATVVPTPAHYPEADAGPADSGGDPDALDAEVKEGKDDDEFQLR